MNISQEFGKIIMSKQLFLLLFATLNQTSVTKKYTKTPLIFSDFQIFQLWNGIYQQYWFYCCLCDRLVAVTLRSFMRIYLE